MNKRTDGQCVRKLSREQIREKTQFYMDYICKKYGDVRDGIYIDLVKMYELMAYDNINFNFCVLDDDTDEISQDICALAEPDEGVVYLKSSVYSGAAEGVTEHRHTLAHELAHLILHGNLPKNGFAKSSNKKHHYTQDSEWQADMAALEILTDHRFLNTTVTADVLSKKAGIGLLTAISRVDELKYLIKK
jgi:Zn-dependent peptidase ImmA (M78 family)